MEKTLEKGQIKKLRQQIEKHDYAYYVLDNPDISDRQYDKVYAELKSLEKQFPELITPDSPTQRVSGKPLDHFEKIKHTIPMLSLQNSYNAEDVLAFNDRVFKFLDKISEKESISYFCEPKLDGLAIELVYQNGVLIKALTRGDGITGENVFSNIKTIKSIPLKLKTNNPPKLLEVRGEVLILKNDFANLNNLQQELGNQTFANPRNAAAGTIRQLDSSIAAQRPLRMYCYSLGSYIPNEKKSSEVNFSSQKNIDLTLKKLSLPTLNSDLTKLCENQNEAIEYYNHINDIREKLPFAIDGVVIKVNDLDLQDQLGFIARSPRWATSVKYEPEQAVTEILNIQIQVGRTGALTPVAIMKPALVGGVTVSNATLHNQDEIDRKDVRIGDTVTIQRAGDVIPEIVNVHLDKRGKKSKPFIIPLKCPTCLEAAVKPEGEAVLRCINIFCDSRIKESLKHFTSRKAMNIDKVGDKIIETFVDNNLIKTFSDLYKLKYDSIISLERQAEKSTNNILDSIKKSRKVSFDRFIYSLGIRFVGEQTARILADHFTSIDDLLSTDEEFLITLDDIGPRVSQSIIEAFSNKQFKQEIKKLRKILEISFPDTLINLNEEHPVFGKSFVITGTLPEKRDLIKSLIETTGGKVIGSVSKKTDYLLAGEESGSKLEKAQKLNVEILDWDNFQTLLKGK